METIFKDFVKYDSFDEDVILKYKGTLPDELIKVWERFGVGAFANNYLKVINPDDYLETLKKCYKRYEQAIPIFTTAMGDIIVWEKDKYVNLLNFRKGYVHVVSSGFEFFFDDLSDYNFMNDELMWQPYPEAINKYGTPNFDECFGYTPLLGLGGSESVENLKKVKLKEHLLIITEFMGAIQ